MLNVSFLSGTRADYGKIKPYIDFLLMRSMYRVHIFITGMHPQEKYGHTMQEIIADYDKTCHLVIDEKMRESSTVLENVHIIRAFDAHLRKDKIDFVFVHGDRPEALSGAFTAMLNNIPVCQIEAGDLSGSVDEALRHAITKLSHQFLVADAHARQVVLRLGENPEYIHIVGNASLANIPTGGRDVAAHYHIPFETFVLLVYHPVTTKTPAQVRAQIRGILSELDHSGHNVIAIMPNNDLYHDVICSEYAAYEHHPRFLFFKSFPYDDFSVLLTQALALVGNSSCGIKEAPFLGVPVIDIGIRQKNRFGHLNLPAFHHLDTPVGLKEILTHLPSRPPQVSHEAYRARFFKTLEGILTDSFWHPILQKKFYGLE
ncbi:MAG: UDP-N-acetylglucosamine 2-epimerase [Alphaproteobacteria bacterium]